MAAYDLSRYDGVLAFGQAIRDVYARRGWARRAWVWHEAADVRVFAPLAAHDAPREGDLVWIGNWGDEERTEELVTFLLEPSRDLGLRTTIHGVRYPDHAKEKLAAHGVTYAGWLPNHRAPERFAKHLFTVHVPRRPYVKALPGIPTIRVFEALACGIPLVSAPWSDAENLFTPGEDFLVAKDGAAMRGHLRALRFDGAKRRALDQRGLRTNLAPHTCGHRVDELLAVASELLPRLRQEATVVPHGTPAVAASL
jgi:spore maturation protein CgeB